MRPSLKYIKKKRNMNKRHKVLVYAGTNVGGALIRLSKKFDICYGFEAHPRIFKTLKKNTEPYKNIEVFNMALTKKTGNVTFYEYQGMPYSSSVGGQMCNKHAKNVTGIKEYTVQSANLMEFLRKKKVDHISLYLSDLQGVDFDVLETIKPLIDTKDIDKIICEVEKDDMEQHYKDLPRNRRANFDKLLNDKYKVVGITTCPEWICSDITWVPQT
jgi:FkbM family methyltransferase